MFDLENLKNTDAKLLSPQVLAFVGDGVYSLYIRHKVVLTENLKGKDLHARVVNFVKASGQSNFIDKLFHKEAIKKLNKKDLYSSNMQKQKVINEAKKRHMHEEFIANFIKQYKASEENK